MELGVGAFGRVALAQDGTVTKTVTRAGAEQLQREYDILMFLRGNPYVIDAFGISHGYVESQLWLQFGGADLLTLIYNQPSNEERERIIHQLFHAVESLHAQEVAHRDLKPENVVVDVTGKVRLIDFNLARKVEGDKSVVTGAVGSEGYCCPEIWKKVRYSLFQADVWSLGVLVTAVLTGHLPWKRAAKTDPFYRFFMTHDGLPSKAFPYLFGTLLTSSFPHIIQLLDRMLRVDPADRMPRLKFF
jgi:serine/threonine protein kinase